MDETFTSSDPAEAWALYFLAHARGAVNITAPSWSLIGGRNTWTVTFTIPATQLLAGRTS